MNNIDFSRPRRMSVAALIIIAWEFFSKHPLELAVGLFIAIRKGRSGWWFPVILLILSVVTSLWRFFTLRYYVRDGFLYIENNYLLIKQRSSLPIDRIHNISEKSNFLYQMTDMVKLRVDSTATQHSELELILTLEEAHQLRAIIAEQEQALCSPTPDLPEEEPSTPSVSNTEDLSALSTRKIRYSFARLFGGIITQSHARSIIAIGAVLLALSNEFMGYVSDNLLYWFRQTLNYTEQVEWESLLISPGRFLITALVIYVLLIIIWTISHLIKLWGTEVTLATRYILYSAGLITNRQKRIRASQIIAMSFKQNPLERLSGQCTLQISQAEADKKEAKEMGGNGIRVFGWREEQELMQWWGINPHVLSTLTPNKRMLYVLVTICIALHLLVATTLVYLELSEWIIVMLPTFALGLWWLTGKYHYLELHLTPTHLYAHHGGTAEIRSWVPYGRIDNVKIIVNPIQRMSGRCRIIISAMDNEYTLGFASQAEAFAFRDKLLYLMER